MDDQKLISDIASDVQDLDAKVRDIAADTDVHTEGRLCYAFTQSKANTTVNGVTFKEA